MKTVFYSLSSHEQCVKLSKGEVITAILEEIVLPLTNLVLGSTQFAA